MPKQPRYTFTQVQSEFLEDYLETYIDALYTEDSAGECEKVIKTAQDNLTEKFELGTDQADAINQSLNAWFRYKSNKSIKKKRVAKPIRVTARKEFHHKNWESLIRPQVVAALGTEDASHRFWLSTMNKTEKKEWEKLSIAEKRVYEKMAKEKNEGTAAKETQIAFANKNFQSQFKKVINDTAKMFNTRIIAIAAREGIEGRKLVSVHEDDNGPKFLRSLDDSTLLKWKAEGYVGFVKGLSEISPLKVASKKSEYVLRFDSAGDPVLPSWSTHSSIDNWRRMFGEYLRILWARSQGASGEKRPPYKTINKNISAYVEAQYLPPRDAITSDFKMEKSTDMEKSMLKAWILHLLARQDLKNQGHPIKVFEWKSQEKTQEKSKSNNTEKKRTKSAKKGKGKAASSDSDDGESEFEEIEIDKALEGWDSDDNGSDRSDIEEVDTFVEDLSQHSSYQELLSLLVMSQQESRARKPPGDRFSSGWATWSSRTRWLPEHVHKSGDEAGDLSGDEAEERSGDKSVSGVVASYIKLWEKKIQDLANSGPHVEHLLLTSGLILRDIHDMQFSLRDPEDAEPVEIPDYAQGSSLTLATEDKLLKLLTTVLKMFDKGSTGHASGELRTSGQQATKQPTAKKLKAPKRSREYQATASDKNSTQVPTSTTTTDPKDAASQEAESDAIVPPPRRIPKPSKPRPDALSRTFDPSVVLPTRPSKGRSQADQQAPTSQEAESDAIVPPPRRIPKPSKPRPDALSRTFDPPVVLPTRPSKGRSQADQQALPYAVNSNTVEESSRQSGRLKDKGRAVYTKGGEIFRNGKQIAGELPDESAPTKRVVLDVGGGKSPTK
ncbi:hypothetical protein QCA50_018702 [Cerrena zonata]|uniref:Uncharacterized protein n=1 Tax=Cerrena zonata TaxID=2478898 RepID=A0AAW0FAM8_9APHY